MMNKIIILFSAFALLQSCQTNNPKVYLIPTLHQLHKVNPQYGYGQLREIVAQLTPDLIAVEIRAEDIMQDSLYLKKNYPYEMWMMKQWFPSIETVGFDWLGSDLEGKAIPENYWKEISAIKKYEKELTEDPFYLDKKSKCNHFNADRIPILKTKSLPEILKSNDGELTEKFYSCLAESLRGSVHQRIADFYERRNLELEKKLKSLIENNRNKKILILTGDDHYHFLKDKIPHQVWLQ
ncbi:hypothetical protein [Chryseobacterium koreense]|uniref:hypothetical protein n=1 Tax=Chryseobacterium koreense TaxID=232216 RepID=UPI0026F18E8B|nr:hypothetical protein [Chryseobacterium koreense]